MMNYFTQRLKFKIDRAELKFARYEAQNIKGPPDRLIEVLSTVYMSRAKLKLVTIMTATSFQDWKALSSREEGDDAFVEGDILRATGNIAGNAANYILRKAGRGLGQGVSNVTSTIGDGIESATGAIGVRALGAGVNSVVSGVGDGVSTTITGGMYGCSAKALNCARAVKTHLTSPLSPRFVQSGLAPGKFFWEPGRVPARCLAGSRAVLS
jgi:vacuolar protein sorting-associated protein 13A/C